MPDVETVIKGTKFKGKQAVEAAQLLRPGDQIRLVRDARNRYDGNAIECHALGLNLGFVAKEANPRIAAAIDAGAEVRCEVIAQTRFEPKIRVSW